MKSYILKIKPYHRILLYVLLWLSALIIITGFISLIILFILAIPGILLICIGFIFLEPSYKKLYPE